MAFTPSPVLIKKAEIFNQSATPSVGMLPSAITPTRDPSTFRVSVALSGADATLVMQATVSGVTGNILLNNGLSLSADVLYTFSFSSSQKVQYDFALGTGGLGVHQLIVEEPTGSLI